MLSVISLILSTISTGISVSSNLLFEAILYALFSKTLTNPVTIESFIIGKTKGVTSLPNISLSWVKVFS